MRSVRYNQFRRELAILAKEKRTPIAGQFELTACCNLDCKMCYIHNADSNALHARELSTETWIRIFDEAYDMGLMFATLTGGECLLRRDFKDLYLHLWNKGVNITIFTNGTLIDDNYVDFFKEYPPKKIRISLYGSNESAYQKVTGHEGFQKVFSAYHKLRNAKIPVGVTITPSSYMKDDFMNIRHLCKESGIKCPPASFYLAKNRDDPNKDDYFLTIDEIVSLARQEALQKGKTLTPVDNPPKPCGDCTESPVGLRCGAGKIGAFVGWDGIMHPCASLHEGTASLLKMSYAEAWEETKALVDRLLWGAECVGCPYENVCPQCPTRRLNNVFSGHCNPEVCELARRLVAAGVKSINQAAELCDNFD